MTIELIEADHLKPNPTKRPWPAPPDAIETFRKWMRERHGIVVYECHLMDSSSMGALTFMPRMFKGPDGKWHPASKHPHMENTAGSGSVPVDWIQPEGDDVDAVLDQALYHFEGWRKVSYVTKTRIADTQETS